MQLIEVDEDDDNERGLTKEEFKQYRRATGQLIWLNEQTSPDLSFDSLNMSYNNRSAKVKDLKEANKVIKKAKERKRVIKFTKLGSFDDLKILAHTDASYLTMENKTRSVSGKMIFLSNKNERNVSPIYWKSKTIAQVCKSAKSAETRSLDLCADDAIFLARAINEIYTGNKGRRQLKVTIKCDNKGVRDSLNSTHQVEEKMMRPIIENIKNMLTRKEIDRVDWVESKSCHADILTKKGPACVEQVLDIFRTGLNFNYTYTR